jgi:hypothetical protein
MGNCDAKAMCGVHSEGGVQKCGMNTCCGAAGWCGVSSSSTFRVSKCLLTEKLQDNLQPLRRTSGLALSARFWVL